jgi:hypothetical protein
MQDRRPDWSRVLLIAELVIQGCINSLREVTPIKLTP